jgi:hypothetical protein
MEKELEYDNKLAVRVLQIRNGYLIKTCSGQFAYGSMDETLKAVEDFYAGRLAK